MRFYSCCYICILKCISKGKRRTSATFTLGRYHIGLEGDVSAFALELDHTQVIKFHWYAAERAIDGMAALNMAVQEDGVIVAAAQGESTLSLTVVDVDFRRLKKELPQGHGQALKPTLTGH